MLRGFGPEFEAESGDFHGPRMADWAMGVNRTSAAGGGGNAGEGGPSGRTSALPGFSVSREHRFVVVVGEGILKPRLDDRFVGLGRVGFQDLLDEVAPLLGGDALGLG